MGFEQYRIENKHKTYSIPDENISSLGEDSELLKKLPKELQSLPWPMEIQGYGYTDKEKKEFTIQYPLGDKFLSFMVIVHELGHLRQFEIHPQLDPEKQENEYDGASLNNLREKDAWGRGIKRLKEFAPEVLDEMRENFFEYKKNGKFEQFDSLDDFIKEVIAIFDKLLEFYSDYYKKTGKERAELNVASYVSEEIKNDNVYKFFINTDDYRCGDKIDQEFATNFIKKMADNISKEVNENS